MANIVTKRVTRAPYEFERNGPITAHPGGHKPDFSLSVQAPKFRDFNPNNTRTTVKQPRIVTLDALFLIDQFGSSDFQGYSSIEAVSKNLNAIDLSTLRQLTAVKKADFSDNKLPLEPFSVMPALEELDLSCNSINSFDFKSSESMTGDDRAWRSLHTLNLSYNQCGSCLTDIQLIPRLTSLNLSYNGLTSLPSNLMHFTCLTYLNLKGNKLNTDSAFFSLATIQSLQTLILDKNFILHVPRFQFGFETLVNISLNDNKLESPEDLSSLADLEQLESISIVENPITLRPKLLSEARRIFATVNVDLKCEETRSAPKSSLPTNLRTVAFDPLTLPSHNKQHIRALNRRRAQQKADQDDQSSTAASTSESVDQPKEKPATSAVTGGGDSFFMTAFGSKSSDEPQPEPTPLPDEEEIPINSIWSEVPVTPVERRVKLTTKKRNDFLTAFRKLEFLTTHPDLRLKPRESPSMEVEEGDTVTTETTPKITVPEPTVSAALKKKKEVSTKLAARTEYTKTEIQQMLQSMEERIALVERDLQVADESGQNAVDIALDQKNFASLHKQYETIRAELINTLNN